MSKITHKDTCSGVYMIKCINTKYVYIGSSANMYRRKCAHLSGLRKNNHNNSSLQAAWNTHGEAAFQFEILEYCSQQELMVLEQTYLDNSPYPVYNRYSNASIGGLGLLGSKRIFTNEHKSNISKAHRGRVFSKETKERMAVAKLGSSQSLTQRNNRSKAMKGRIITPEAIEKQRATVSRPVNQYSMSGDLIKEWKGATYAAAELWPSNRKRAMCDILTVCRESRKHYKGFIWKYTNQKLN